MLWDSIYEKKSTRRRDCGRRQVGEKLIEIEHGKHDEQHRYADCQLEDTKTSAWNWIWTNPTHSPLIYSATALLLVALAVAVTLIKGRWDDCDPGTNGVPKSASTLYIRPGRPPIVVRRAES
jgi:hypothetical protein